MKTLKIQKTWSFEPLEEIKLTNCMAPMIIDASEDSQIHLEGILSCDISDEDIELEDYILAKHEGVTFKLDLDDLPVDQRDVKTSQLKLSIPGGVFLNIETDNFPLSIIGMLNDMKIFSENSPISVKHCEANLHIESENGPLKLHNIKGNIYAKMENGPVMAEDIVGEGLHVESENGPIKLRLASFNKVEVETENGPIHYETQPVEGGDFSFTTENGIVHLVLPLRFSFKLSAETESGRFKSKLDTPVEKEDNTFRIEALYDEDEPTTIKIHTENGLIKLSSDGHINMNYIKVKMEQLKEVLLNVKTTEELNKALQKLNVMVDYLHRSAQSIDEEKIKTKVNEATDKLKAMAQEFDLSNAGTVMMGKVEGLSSEIYDGIKEGLRNVKAEFDGIKYEHLNTDSLKEYINKVVNSPLIKPYLSAEKKRQESEEIADRSRLKILDMLEAGKITSEEAERLLKAIHKE
jgi:hypothetical protein